MSKELKYPTLAIQLKNEKGIPYDMPEDWLETDLKVANIIYQKYQVGIDAVSYTHLTLPTKRIV